MSEKNVLAFLGSPHVNGVTAAMLDCAVCKAKKAGYTVNEILLLLFTGRMFLPRLKIYLTDY